MKLRERHTHTQESFKPRNKSEERKITGREIFRAKWCESGIGRWVGGLHQSGQVGESEKNRH